MKNLFVAFIAVALISISSSSNAHAQLRRIARMSRPTPSMSTVSTAKVVSPDAHESNTPALSPSPEPDSGSAGNSIESRCDCNGNPPVVDPNCRASNCDYKARPGTAVPHTTSRPYGPVRPPSIECNPPATTIPFYSNEFATKTKLDVPVAVRECREVIRFERKTFEVCSCKIELCVPCMVDCTEVRECRLVNKEIPVSVRKRTNKENGQDVYDIWVVDPSITELPIPSVVGISKTQKQLKDDYGIELNP